MFNDILPPEYTEEELMFVELVKIDLLKKMTPRERFVFLYIMEMGGSQVDCAKILGTNDRQIRRIIDNIRGGAWKLRKGYFVRKAEPKT